MDLPVGPPLRKAEYMSHAIQMMGKHMVKWTYGKMDGKWMATNSNIQSR